MTDLIHAWQCIGCGSIEAPQTCVGVCEHRRVEFVAAYEHARVVTELAHVRAELSAARALLRKLSTTHPRGGGHEASYRAMQQAATTLLGRHAERSTPHTSNAMPASPDVVGAVPSHQGALDARA